MNDAAPVSADVTTADPTRPGVLADFYELTKPRLNFLVIVTTVVGYYIAARYTGAPVFDWTLLHALLGTGLTAASAATLNQVVERDYDALMRRTKDRPLAAGRISLGHGMAFGLMLGIAGVAYLFVAVNVLTGILGILTWLIYLLIYTPLKRHSPLNTLVGAITGALPPAMGVTAVTNSVTPLAIVLFAILFVWQMPHFFALALMYKDDYALGGFQMLPNATDGDRRTRSQAILFAAMLIPISLLPIFDTVSRAGWLYGIGAVALGILFLKAAIVCAKRQPKSEKKLFLTSILYLPALLAVLMLDQ
jgi:heme o synthase